MAKISVNKIKCASGKFFGGMERILCTILHVAACRGIHIYHSLILYLIHVNLLNGIINPDNLKLYSHQCSPAAPIQVLNFMSCC